MLATTCGCCYVKTPNTGPRPSPFAQSRAWDCFFDAAAACCMQKMYQHCQYCNMKKEHGLAFRCATTHGCFHRAVGQCYRYRQILLCCWHATHTETKTETIFSTRARSLGEVWGGHARSEQDTSAPGSGSMISHHACLSSCMPCSLLREL